MSQARHCGKKKKIPKKIDAERRADTQQKRRRRQKASGFKRFLPIVAAPEMVAETAARERRDPSTPPKVEGGTETPSKAVDPYKTSVGVDAIAPPSGGAAMRPNTNTPVVALPSGGEAPAAQEVNAMREKIESDNSESGGRMETGGSREAEHLMSVKVELALAKTEEDGRSKKTDENGVRKAIGGKMRLLSMRLRASCFPTRQNVWGARV